MNNGLNHWFERLGYDAFPHALHYSSEAVNRTHPYSAELNALMNLTFAEYSKCWISYRILRFRGEY